MHNLWHGYHSWQPSVDVEEQADAYVISMDVPGVRSADIEVIREKDVLTIKGKRETTQTTQKKLASDKDDDKQDSAAKPGYSFHERSVGSFCRRFTLTDSCQVDNIVARCQDGVLEIRIPKQEEEQPVKVAVHSA